MPIIGFSDCFSSCSCSFNNPCRPAGINSLSSLSAAFGLGKTYLLQIGHTA